MNEATEDALAWKLGPQAYIQLNYPELLAKIQGGQPQQQPQAGGQEQPIQGEPPATGGEPGNAALSQVPLPA